ncbi:alpha-1,6-mannosylglycoprotein 6-beta-N-acetylglucosaminyltransferase A-like isoform X2 [Ostrea edulis]|uniref:alpha-1,6-mannosylglycoprotein 6-beta-N-acetylglucosaminyltransferase A-like isoform X2 n=1 Tax=Ostrea edulis TaxID=37623 RepID=UPI0024AF2597|nr:alpha-1,6-mannosylglycoprotein 6-beta-N-acetylglucosaminyltransferase A-like isoform X2 [Ostrea edulis]
MVSPWRLRIFPNSRQLLVVACILFFFWCMTLYRVSNISPTRQKESEVLKNEIIGLSEKYVRALSRENNDIVDGPYAGRFTAYDLKKTMAVLLESMLERLSRLEVQVHQVINMSNSSIVNLTRPLLTDQTDDSLHAEGTTETLGVPELVNNKEKQLDLILGRTEACTLTEQDKQVYSKCEGKLEWMRQMWQSDACYASYGVDGSECSFLMYLSEVEGWCPKRTWKKSIKVPVEDVSKIQYADINDNIEDLMKILVDPNERQGYAWIRMRVRKMWPKWVTAVNRLKTKQDLNKRRRKKILVHLGLLSKQSGWGFAENQFKGGPLGELVQWSDLICTLYVLGHQLTITSETYQLEKILSQLPAANSPCQSRKDLPVHIIYTDIVGLRQFKRYVKGGYGKFSCLLRIVDSFGTEPAYNLRSYAKAHKILTSWGGQDLLPQQLFTMFPHSPDNSFMGFVVEQHLNDSDVKGIKRENWALIYGKNDYMYEGKIDYLETIKRSLEVHGTVYVDEKAKNRQSFVPSFVINHGLQKPEDFHVLLRKSKVFVGLGFPYEGPAPLEAIANGAIFINPKFSVPHSSKNTPFFKGKPTARELTSQHPYAELFIGEPFVYTVNINDQKEVMHTMDKILFNKEFKPHMPYEFTEEGMLQRMNSYIEHQKWCQFQKQEAKWPPESALSYVMGSEGQSCKDACWDKGLICEPSHFPQINSARSLKQAEVECSQEDYVADIFYPGYDPNTMECSIQREELLFSCVGKKNNFRRYCPCRNYIKGQTALCKQCV